MPSDAVKIEPLKVNTSSSLVSSRCHSAGSGCACTTSAKLFEMQSATCYHSPGHGKSWRTQSESSLHLIMVGGPYMLQDLSRRHRPCWPNGRSESLSLCLSLSGGTISMSAQCSAAKFEMQNGPKPTKPHLIIAGVDNQPASIGRPLTCTIDLHCE